MNLWYSCSLLLNGGLAFKFLNIDNWGYIVYSILGNYLLAITLCLCSIYTTIILVNYIQYTKYNYPRIHHLLSNMLIVFTLNTAETKFLCLSVLLYLPIVYTYGIYVVALFYNVNFMSMFFYELTNEYKNSYDTIAVYQNRISMFFKNSHNLYLKHMFNRVVIMFFMIAGDNWILDNISDGDDIYNKLAYIGLFNIIATILYIFCNLYIFN